MLLHHESQKLLSPADRQTDSRAEPATFKLEVLDAIEGCFRLRPPAEPDADITVSGVIAALRPHRILLTARVGRQMPLLPVRCQSLARASVWSRARQNESLPGFLKAASEKRSFAWIRK